MPDSPRVLLLAPRLKDYWASQPGQNRVARVLTLDALRLPKRTYQLNIGAYFALAFYARLIAGRFDVVICVDRHLALAFGMIKQLTGLKTPVLAHQFILPDADDAKRKPFAATWDRVASKGINRVVVNSSHETTVYTSLLSQRTNCEFIPLGVPPVVFDVVVSLHSAPFVFSGGGAKRDYPTLMRAARNLSCSVEIVTFSQRNLEGETPPDNVRICYNLPFADFLHAMASAWAVVIPLHQSKRSAGQVTIIYAQAMGKAVIASDIPSIRDYISHNANGLLVPPGDPGQLQRAIEAVLSNADLRARLERNARTHAVNTYSFTTYDQEMGRILDDLAAASSGL